MTKLEAMRREIGLSRLALGYEAHVPQVAISRAERGVREPYKPQLARLAMALGFAGDPQELLSNIEHDVLSRAV